MASLLKFRTISLRAMKRFLGTRAKMATKSIEEGQTHAAGATEEDSNGIVSSQEVFGAQNNIRYKVCQERIPVHKTVRIKPSSYDQHKEMVNKQNLQPRMLPNYFSAHSK
ncbi:hypothetical protein JTB14_006121 [Gonioctena quinquepunctata]|nr:hypothetical protein JTB14_006121 [Gonioctena quinquepunctata]